MADCVLSLDVLSVPVIYLLPLEPVLTRAIPSRWNFDHSFSNDNVIVQGAI